MQDHKNHRKLGTIGETLALNFLLKKGYSLIERNYCIQGGEIDLILKKDGVIDFIEVKTRWNSRFGNATEALGYGKKQKLLRAICSYLRAKNLTTCWQCDLIAIQFSSQDQATVHHFKNVFTE